MKIGAHVSTAGGLQNVVPRAVDLECDAIQIFPQSSRAWRPTLHSDADVEAFREAMEVSRVDAVMIHAVYLVNCASLEAEVRSKSLAALKHAVSLGDRIGSIGVVLHPGSTKGNDYDKCMAAVGAALKEVLAETDSCPILLEDTAGANGTLGRDFDELARLVELGGGSDRLGICLDCCHMLASGFEVRQRESLTRIVDDFEEKLGLERLQALHINDSVMPLGSNRDRHASLGEGELGDRGLRVFLSEPRFDGLPAALETPGPDRSGPNVAEIRKARRLLREGRRNRRRSAN